MRKSPCCAATIRRFGGRRRQCAYCLKTWRVRKRRRGRPRLRADPKLLHRVFRQHRTLTELADRRGLSRQAVGHRFLAELGRQLIRERRQLEPSGGSILICDALWCRFRGRLWVLYLMAIRPVDGNRAFFLDPLLSHGPESRTGWERALSTIPSEQRTRIRAFVVDNFKGCTTIARENSWVLQLCHFHIIATLRAKLGGVRRRDLKDGPLRQEAFRLIKAALKTADQVELDACLDRIRALHAETSLHRKIRHMLREFIRRIAEYRAYRAHPHLALPRTTGSAESMVRVIRDLMRRTRNFSSPRAFRLWVTNYIRVRPEIACNRA